PWVIDYHYHYFDEEVYPADSDDARRAVAHFTRSMSPVAAFDVEFEDLNAMPGPAGALTVPVMVPVGAEKARRIAVFNDDLAGEDLVLRWSSGSSSGERSLTVPIGEFAVVEVPVTVDVEGDAVLRLDVSKHGRSVYTS